MTFRLEFGIRFVSLNGIWLFFCRVYSYHVLIFVLSFTKSSRRPHCVYIRLLLPIFPLNVFFSSCAKYFSLNMIRCASSIFYITHSFWFIYFFTATFSSNGWKYRYAIPRIRPYNENRTLVTINSSNQGLNNVLLQNVFVLVWPKNAVNRIINDDDLCENVNGIWLISNNIRMIL